MCSRLRKSVMDCRWFSWHMMFQLGLGLLYVWAQTILYVVFVHAFSNTLNFFFHVFIFLMDTVSYGVEWWKKSDGFPLILLIHDIATSYFWQHHMHIFFFCCQTSYAYSFALFSLFQYLSGILCAFWISDLFGRWC